MSTLILARSRLIPAVVATGSMPCRPRTCALITAILVLAAPAAQAGTITDYLDRIGGCRKPMSESFSYEVSPYTPKPYGKALADWTDQDLSDYRAYFVACQTRRPDWPNMGEFNRNERLRVIDTAMAELRYKVGDARAAARSRQAAAAQAAEQQARDEAQRQSQAEAAARQAQADQAVQSAQARRNEEVRRKARPLLQEVLAFAQNELDALPPEQKIARLDGYIARMEAVGREIGDVPAAKPFLAVLRDVRTLREQLASEQAAQAPATRTGQDIRGQAGASGSYTDFEWLGQRGIMAVANPLQREDFRASLSRGIDFNVGVSAIERSASGWLVQLSGRLGVPGKPGQGFFCRVNGNDAASLAVLRGITPPYGIVHVTAPGADEFLMHAEPLLVRIVFSPCRVSTPDNGSTRAATSGRADRPLPPNGPGPGTPSSALPIAPSPPGLRCQNMPPRREPERAMAHRLRQVWAIPEALRGDPSLKLTFAVKLNFDAEITASVELLSANSERATPEQLQAAVEAAQRAINTSAPFPELGQLAGGTMQIDLTPCD